MGTSVKTEFRWKGDSRKDCLEKCERLKIFWYHRGYPDVKAWPSKHKGWYKTSFFYIVKSDLVNGAPAGYQHKVPISAR